MGTVWLHRFCRAKYECNVVVWKHMFACIMCTYWMLLLVYGLHNLLKSKIHISVNFYDEWLLGNQQFWESFKCPKWRQRQYFFCPLIKSHQSFSQFSFQVSGDLNLHIQNVTFPMYSNNCYEFCDSLLSLEICNAASHSGEFKCFRIIK